MSSQTKLGSIVEALTNTAIGLVIAFGAQTFLFWAYDVQVSHSQNAWIVFWMTIVSVVRSYWCRRLFNLAPFRRLFGG